MTGSKHRFSNMEESTIDSWDQGNSRSLEEYFSQSGSDSRSYDSRSYDPRSAGADDLDSLVSNEDA
jgi:hypothetical protein